MSKSGGGGRAADARPPADVISARRRARAASTTGALAAALAPDLILVVDDQDRVTFANARLLDLLGYPYLPFLALDLLLEESSLGRLKRLLRDAEEGVPSPVVPLAWRQKDGGPRILDVRVARAEGQTILVAREPDAGRTRAQRLAEQAGIAQRMAHDLRNLMTYVFAVGDMLKIDQPRALENAAALLQRSVVECEEYLARIDLAVRPLQKLTPHDLAPLLEEAAREAAARAPGRAMRVRCEAQPRVMADGQRLRAALSALFEAALALVPAGATVEITLGAQAGIAQLRLCLPARLDPAELEADLQALDFSPKRQKRGDLAIAAHVLALHGGGLHLVPPEDCGPFATELLAELPVSGLRPAPP